MVMCFSAFLEAELAWPLFAWSTSQQYVLKAVLPNMVLNAQLYLGDCLQHSEI